MSENTVKAENQLKTEDYITYEGSGTARIMFVGNSITRHGVKDEIGWHWDFGMAASCKENDYVHRVIRELDKRISARYCICQASAWEVHHKDPETVLESFVPARDFAADIIVMRLGENCANQYDAEAFERNYPKFVDFLNAKSGKVLFTTCFWHNDSINPIIEKIAKEMSCPCVALHDLGSDPKMRADGLFEHEGVAYHPGDAGMAEIAKRICSGIEKLI